MQGGSTIARSSVAVGSPGHPLPVVQTQPQSCPFGVATLADACDVPAANALSGVRFRPSTLPTPLNRSMKNERFHAYGVFQPAVRAFPDYRVVVRIPFGGLLLHRPTLNGSQLAPRLALLAPAAGSAHGNVAFARVHDYPATAASRQHPKLPSRRCNTQTPFAFSC